jgi:hypothetical protein
MSDFPQQSVQRLKHQTDKSTSETPKPFIRVRVESQNATATEDSHLDTKALRWEIQSSISSELRVLCPSATQHSWSANFNNECSLLSLRWFSQPLLSVEP